MQNPMRQVFSTTAVADRWDDVSAHLFSGLVLTPCVLHPHEKPSWCTYDHHRDLEALLECALQRLWSKPAVFTWYLTARYWEAYKCSLRPLGGKCTPFYTKNTFPTFISNRAKKCKCILFSVKQLNYMKQTPGTTNHSFIHNSSFMPNGINVAVATCNLAIIHQFQPMQR